MCGIAGLVDRARAAGDQPDTTVRDMVRTLRHRGPDDEGVWVDPSAGVALALQRLAIVDLSIAGHQPMHSASRRYVVVFNGEIYNFLELRAELEAMHWSFRGRSDTEVFLAAVDQWGHEVALKRSNGMFALALWDRKERVLCLARDRMGEKPLYYAWLHGVFVFGSELRALRAHPLFDCEVDRDALALFVRHNNIPAPFSIYRGVYKLPAATTLSIDLDNVGSVPRATPYWSLREIAERGTRTPYAGTAVEAAEELESLLSASVRARMLADVPIGAFLSGGIDSSTVVAFMSAQKTGRVKTFSIGSEDVLHDEGRKAAAVAKHLGTDHTELCVSPADALSLVPLLPTLYDEPFADSSQIPTYLLAKLARKDVTVSLSGDGGDELFGGYTRHVSSEQVWKRTHWLPKPVRTGLAGALSMPSAATWDSLFRLAHRFSGGSIKGSADRVQKLAMLVGVEAPGAIYTELVSNWRDPSIVLHGNGGDTVLAEVASWPSVATTTERMLYLDAASYLPNDILVKVDRATMAVSLEARLPFLDPSLIEFAWRIPLSMKIHRGQGKWLLRQVLKRYVPPNLTERPKAGFAVPIDSWLRGPLRSWAEGLLDPYRLRAEGFLDPGPIRQKWNEHLSGRRDWQGALWCVLMFQAWLEQSGRARETRSVA